MAAIDKIYGSNDQWIKFNAWAVKNRSSILPSFYPLEGYDDVNCRPITNLSEEEDMWLLDNCPLKFVTDRIKEQYCL